MCVLYTHMYIYYVHIHITYTHTIHSSMYVCIIHYNNMYVQRIRCCGVFSHKWSIYNTFPTPTAQESSGKRMQKEQKNQRPMKTAVKWCHLGATHELIATLVTYTKPVQYQSSQHSSIGG